MDHMFSILGWEGLDPQTSGTFYKTIIKVTLLFDLETWGMNPMIGLTLGVFCLRVSRRLQGIQLKRGITGQW